MSIGSIQHCEKGSITDGNDAYVFVILFDLYSVLLCLQHMHGEQALMTMDGTMFGKQPRIGASSSTSSAVSNIVHEGPAKHGYLSAIYWLINDDNNIARTDSQSKCMIPTVEIIIHNNTKSGVPATLLTQANTVIMSLLRRALKCIKTLLPTANLPKDLNFRYVEADNGLAERLSSATIFGRHCILLRERWHTKKCSDNFIDELEKASIFSAFDKLEATRIMTAYFHAMSAAAADKALTRFSDYVDGKVSEKITTKGEQMKHKKHFVDSVGTTVFKSPMEVCDFGRKNIAWKVSSGPIAETVNSVMKNEIGAFTILCLFLSFGSRFRLCFPLCIYIYETLT